MTGSALYSGQVQHLRRRPKRHKLRYQLFNLLLDLDELPALSRTLLLFGFDRAALVSFHQRDHGAGTMTGLQDWVRAQLDAGGFATDGAIRLLCMPRVFGHCFNPLSVYFCYHPNARLKAILYQVNNTFGQRHSYLIPVEPDGSTGSVRQACGKVFYVSPFMDMDLRYQFVIQPPSERIAVTVNVLDVEGLLLAASFAGTRRPLSDRVLLSALLRFPLLGLQVLAGIHWEAVKIWSKGIRFRPRPSAPACPVTIVPAAGVQG